MAKSKHAELSHILSTHSNIGFKRNPETGGFDGLSDAQMAKLYGIEEPYCHQLLRIARNVDPEITQAWRESENPLLIKQMIILADIMIKGRSDEIDRKGGRLLETIEKKEERINHCYAEQRREYMRLTNG